MHEILSQESPIWIHLHVPSHQRRRSCTHTILSAWASNTIFLSFHIFVLICSLLVLLIRSCTLIFLHPGIYGGIVEPVFTYEFAVNASIDKPVNKYFPVRLPSNKCSHECSFASKFLDKSSSVHISAGTCFGICLPIGIWRYTGLKIHIHTWLCMRMQVQRMSPHTFLFYPHLFSLDSAAISFHTKSKQWGRRRPSKQIMALIQVNSGEAFLPDTVLPALVICIWLYMFPFEAWGTLLVPPCYPRAKETIREYNEHKQWWRLNLTFCPPGTHRTHRCRNIIEFLWIHLIS